MEVPLTDLPDLLTNLAGVRLATTAQWPGRRRELLLQAVQTVYGELPATPQSTRCVCLHTAVVRHMAGARLSSLRVEVDGRHAFLLRLFVPDGAGPFPVVLHGDGCWAYATDAVVASLLGRGYAFAQFNRVEVAPDMPDAAGVFLHDGILQGQRCGALAAWAWAYHRAVDALCQLEFVNQQQIAVVGHSRGGKAALLAGATDERIAVTSANNSGAAGAGSFCCLGPGAETLGDVVRVFPHWFGPELAQYVGRERCLGFDQHFLLALIAPRALLTTEALDDHWANPLGSWQMHRAAREVYTFLGVPDAIAVVFRAGGHAHHPDDWKTLLDYCDAVFRNLARATTADPNPFPDVPLAQSWIGQSRAS